MRAVQLFDLSGYNLASNYYYSKIIEIKMNTTMFCNHFLAFVHTFQVIHTTLADLNISYQLKFQKGHLNKHTMLYKSMSNSVK